MVNIEAERVSPRQQDIDPKVKLELFNKKGVFNIPLNDILVAIDNVLNIPGQKNASSLWQSLRLDNVSASVAFGQIFVVMPKLAELHRNCPCFREEVKLIGMMVLHCHEVQPKQVLVCEDINPREMVDTLMKMHPE